MSPFQEKEVDKYFAHFEKVADSLNWPKESWVVLLQSVLVGKTQEIYGSLSVEQSSNYEHVKEAILKAYELVPEAYKQKFRNYLKYDREKENFFNRWCHSKEVGQDFEKLKQMGLLEEFEGKVRPDIRSHLDEQKVEELEKAAVMAGDYAVTQEMSNKSGNPKQKRYHGSGNRENISRKMGLTSLKGLKVSLSNESENSKGVKVNPLIDRNNFVEENKGIKVNPLNDVKSCIEEKLVLRQNQITWRIISPLYQKV